MKTVDFAAAAGTNEFRLEAYFRTAEGGRVCSTCRKSIPTAVTLGNRNLSLRERQLVDLICHGKLNKEIAYELQLSMGTVKEYLFRLFKKVGVRNRTELAILALTRTATAA